MDIDLVFAYNITNNSLILKQPNNESVKDYANNIINSFKKLDNKKLIILKRIEIKFGKTNKKIYMIKFDEKFMLGVLCGKTNNQNQLFNFLDEFYLKFKVENFPIKSKSKIHNWLKKEIKELKKGERKSVYDNSRSYRSISRSRSKSQPKSNKLLKMNVNYLIDLEKKEKQKKKKKIENRLF